MQKVLLPEIFYFVQEKNNNALKLYFAQPDPECMNKS